MFQDRKCSLNNLKRISCSGVEISSEPIPEQFWQGISNSSVSGLGLWHAYQGNLEMEEMQITSQEEVHANQNR